MSEHEQMIEDIRYIRERVDDTNKQVSDLRVSVEHRLTRVETRATIFGAISGGIAAFVASLFYHK